MHQKQHNIMKLGVIGYPVSHSLSPVLHGYWIEKHGLAADYKAMEIAGGMLERTVKALVDKGYRGFNVTLPYKQDIMGLCDYIDDTARKIGAVNTVTIENGVLYGNNTDSYGFSENLKQSGASYAKNNALVLGAGGAARAVIHGLQQMGLKNIIIANRTQETAEAMAKEFTTAQSHVCSIPWKQRDVAGNTYDLVVNTTSLGMAGQPALEFNVQHLPQHCVVCDIVYKPLYTGLLSDARENGLQTVTGIGMLVHQARLSFLKWTGIMPEDSAILQHRLQQKQQEQDEEKQRAAEEARRLQEETAS